MSIKRKKTAKNLASVLGSCVRSLAARVVLLALVCSVSSVSRPVSDEELFLQGNNYYRQGDYNQALSSYQGMKRKGRAVFYNMGNCYNYMHNSVDALVAWRQAQCSAGHQEFGQIERMIQALKSAQSDAQAGTKQLSYGAFFERVLCPYPLFWLQIVFLLLWYALFIMRRYKSWFTTVLYLCILGCMILVSMGIWIKIKKTRYPGAVVVQDQVTVHAGPGSKFHTLGSLALIDEVEVKEQAKEGCKMGWCKVESEDKKIIGWVPESSLKIISEQ